jgi:hypothetical protein
MIVFEVMRARTLADQLMKPATVKPQPLSTAPKPQQRRPVKGKPAAEAMFDFHDDVAVDRCELATPNE